MRDVWITILTLDALVDLIAKIAPAVIIIVIVIYLLTYPKRKNRKIEKERIKKEKQTKKDIINHQTAAEKELKKIKSQGN